jgi:hypothetical protein
MIKKYLSIILLISITLASCSSTTRINSNPEGAKVFINEEYKGTTPYIHKDTKPVWSSIEVKLIKENYKDFVVVIKKDEEFNAGACAGGVFLLFPFIWITGYQPDHTYELKKK